MKSSALRGRIRPKHQITIVAVCVAGSAHEGEALEGVGSRLAQALHVRRILQLQRHPAPGSWSNQSAHGPSTMSSSFTLIHLSVLAPAKVPRIASNFLEQAPQLWCNLHHSLRPVPGRHHVRKDTRTAKWCSSWHCRAVSAGPILPRALPRLSLQHLHPHLPPRLPPRMYLRWYLWRCLRRHLCLLRPSSHPRPSSTSQLKNSPCRLPKLLMMTHSSCAIPLLRLSFLYLCPHRHKLNLPLVHQAQPYHRLYLHPSHTLLLRQRAGSSGAPHLHTFKRLSRNPHQRLDMPPLTPMPPCQHPR